LIDAHRGAFEYDWRTRFLLPLSVVGESMSWGEALRLFRILQLDTASAVGSALAQFDRPTSRESLMLMEVYDSLEVARAGRKAKRYPRPWGDKARRTIGRARLTVQRLRQVLDAHRASDPESEEVSERG
jgi:hypothetical protein